GSSGGGGPVVNRMPRGLSAVPVYRDNWPRLARNAPGGTAMPRRFLSAASRTASALCTEAALSRSLGSSDASHCRRAAHGSDADPEKWRALVATTSPTSPASSRINGSREGQRVEVVLRGWPTLRRPVVSRGVAACRSRPPPDMCP
ncbi:unnamed protein product, partial [Ixodes persulcatus]